MLLKVNGKTIGDVVGEKLEFLNYEPRRVFGDNCNDSLTVIDETFCYLDIGTHTFSDFIQMEWMYKLINYSIDKAQRGVINEWQNISEALQCFPCG